MTTLRTLRAALAVLLMAGSVPLLTTGVAQAHDEIVGSVPAENSTVATPPTTVELQFDRVIDPRYADVALSIAEPEGEGYGSNQRIDADVEFDEMLILAAPSDPSVIPAGPHRWTVGYRLLSDDGHPVGGAFTFEVESGGAVGSVEVTADSEANSSGTATTDAGSSPPTVDISQTPAADEDQDAAGESDSSGFPVWAALAAAAAGLAGVAFLVFRRMRRPATSAGPPGGRR